MRALLVIAVLGMVGCGPREPETVDSNLVPNGSFEVLEQGAPVGWHGVTGPLEGWSVEGPAASGTVALHAEDGAAAVFSDSFAVESGADYELAISVRAAGGATGELVLHVAGPTSSGLHLPPPARIALQDCESWCTLSTSLLVPDSAATARVIVTASGPISIDLVRLFR